jgi:hypothetical protein
MYTHDNAVAIAAELAEVIVNTADKHHITRDGNTVRALAFGADRNQARIVRIAGVNGGADLVAVTVAGPLVRRVLDRDDYIMMAGIDDTSDVNVEDVANRLIAALEA